MSEFDTTTDTTATDDGIDCAYPAEYATSEEPSTFVETLDIDGDGIADGYATYDPASGQMVAVLDVTNDGVADFYSVDVTGDGLPDATVVRDGDTFTVQADNDLNGLPDYAATYTAEEFVALYPGIAETLGVTSTQIVGGIDTAAGSGDELVSSESVDIDGDGVADGSLDTYGDGSTSLVLDLDGDGTIDYVDLDLDGDGTAESYVYAAPDGSSELGTDTDGDGYVDTIEVDADGDGATDAIYVDTDGDGSFEPAQ